MTGGEESDTKFRRLIRDLTRDRERKVARREVEEIRAHISRMPFDGEVRRVHRRHRGLYDGEDTLGESEGSLTIHRVLRTVYDEQWAAETTNELYVSDLRAAALDSSARIAVGQPTGSQPLVYVFAETEKVVPENRRGPRTLPITFVLYGSHSEVIITGYQVSEIQTVRTPPTLRWLR